MRLLVLALFALVAVANAAPISQESEDAYIIDKIVDVDQLKKILAELLEHGKNISKATLEQMMEVAKGAAKEMLKKIIEKMGQGYSMDESEYIIDKIIDVDRLKQILQELLEHGKTIGKSTLEQLLKIAKGAARDMIIKLLEQMNQQSAYALDQSSISETIRQILESIKNGTKDVAIKQIREALEAAKGAMKQALEKLLERLQAGQEPETYILNQLGIDKEKIMEVLKVLKEHGKVVAIDMLKKMMETAKGAFKQLLLKMMEQLIIDEMSYDSYALDRQAIEQKIRDIMNSIANGGKDAAIQQLRELVQQAKGALKQLLERLMERLEGEQSYIIDKIIDVDQVKKILAALLEHGKNISKDTLQQMLEVAKGAAKQMIQKLLEKMGQSTYNLPDAYIIDKIVDVDRLKQILQELLEHGKTIGKSTLEQLLKIAKGAARDMIIKLLETMEKQQESTYLAIDRETIQQKLKEIMDAIKAGGSDAAIKLIQDALKSAHGTVKALLEKLLERLEN